MQEIDIIRRVQHHPHIIGLIDIFEEGSRVFFIMPFMEGGDLFHKLSRKPRDRRRFTEAEVRRILLQIARGIEYLHGLHICHRDLKPENLLCTREEENFQVVIADFGLSKDFEQGKMRTECGSGFYAAPEVHRHEEYTEKCDIWSYGVIAFVLFTGTFPFRDKDQNPPERLPKSEHLGYIVNNMEIEKGRMESLSPEAKEFLTRLLNQKAPEDRPTASDLVEDPWLNARNARHAPDVDLSHSLALFEEFVEYYDSLSYTLPQKGEAETLGPDDNSFMDDEEEPF